MAATRYSAPSGLIKRGRTAQVCGTCGKSRLMHGHRGALQRPFACEQKCYNTYRQFSAVRTFAAQGLGYATGVNPATPGGKAR